MSTRAAERAGSGSARCCMLMPSIPEMNRRAASSRLAGTSSPAPRAAYSRERAGGLYPTLVHGPVHGQGLRLLVGPHPEPAQQQLERRHLLVRLGEHAFPYSPGVGQHDDFKPASELVTGEGTARGRRRGRRRRRRRRCPAALSPCCGSSSAGRQVGPRLRPSAGVVAGPGPSWAITRAADRTNCSRCSAVGTRANAFAAFIPPILDADRVKRGFPGISGRGAGRADGG